ncbi:hypothetical protein [Desulfofalx alkaliphila]|nr:hypothetical protein [Desulfofalx alkaliphila]
MMDKEILQNYQHNYRQPAKDYRGQFLWFITALTIIVPALIYIYG